MKHTKTFCFFTLFICLSFLTNLYGQNLLSVKDKNTGEALSGVTVHLNAVNLVAITNDAGICSLNNIPDLTEEDQLTFSHISYSRLTLSYKELMDNQWLILLEEREQELETVTVTGARPRLKLYLDYEKRSSMPEPLYSFGAALVGDTVIYVVAGDQSNKGSAALKAENDMGSAPGVGYDNGPPVMLYQGFSDKMFKYYVEEDRWEVSDKQFRKRAYHNLHYYHNRLYVLGGLRYATNKRREYLDETVEVYDLLKDTVLVDPVNPHQAVNAASVLFGNSIIVAGGSVRRNKMGEKEYTHKVHQYNLDTGHWYEMPAIPYNKEARGVVLGNKLYFLGGYRHRPLEYIDAYDLLTGEYKSEKNLFMKRGIRESPRTES